MTHINEDAVHVLLDGLLELEAAIVQRGAKPWRDYEAGNKDDPKADRDRYRQLVREARELVSRVLAQQAAELRVVEGTPQIEVLHVREPDEGCNVRVWVDGAETSAYIEDIDPGRGWQASEWDENRDSTLGNAELSESFRDHAVMAYNAGRESKYVEKDEDDT